MMEFTLSRSILIICSILLLGAVAVPMSDYFSSEKDRTMEELAEKDCRIIDMAIDSGAEEITLSGNLLLPSQSYSLIIEEHKLTIIDSGQECYTAYMQHKLNRLELGFGDVIILDNQVI